MNSNSGQNNTPFNKLLNDNWDYVFNYILKKTSDDYIAEEITIQTFSKAFQKIKLYDKKFSFSWPVFEIYLQFPSQSIHAFVFSLSGQ